jgi:hypothetical protein
MSPELLAHRIATSTSEVFRIRLKASFAACRSAASSAPGVASAAWRSARMSWTWRSERSTASNVSAVCSASTSA